MAPKFVPVTVAVEPGVSVDGEIALMDASAAPAGAATTRLTVALTPSLTAVIMVLPPLAVVTRPLASTAATRTELELQLTLLPAKLAPFLSARAAVIVKAWPATIPTGTPLSVTAFTGGGKTVALAEPDLPSTVAVIVAVPTARPVTTPVAAMTGATAGFDELHVGDLPETSALNWSRISALIAVVVPCSIVASAGDTEMSVTTGAVGPPVPGDVPGSPPPHASRKTTVMVPMETWETRIASKSWETVQELTPVNGEPLCHAWCARVRPMTPWARRTIFRHSPRAETPLKTATFETNRGTITAELYDTDAPKTVENFEKLANEGFYDGVKFHRVIPDFVVQGGDPLSKDLPDGDPRVGSGGPGWKIKCETAGNPRKHEVGALSMAHAGKDTGGSQFFMVLSEDNTRHLNGVHTVFGKITGGIDFMKQIKKNDVMNSVRVV